MGVNSCFISRLWIPYSLSDKLTFREADVMLKKQQEKEKEIEQRKLERENQRNRDRDEPRRVADQGGRGDRARGGITF